MDEVTYHVITEAAALLQVSRSAFVTDAARQAAETVIAPSDVTLMSAEVFERMMASLNDAGESPELSGLAALPRRVHRGELPGVPTVRSRTKRP